MVKMVAFDLDGTVCDSIPFCIEAFKKAASAYTGGILTEKEIVNTFGLNEAGMMKAIVKTDWENALDDFMVIMKRCTISVLRLLMASMNL